MSEQMEDERPAIEPKDPPEKGIIGSPGGPIGAHGKERSDAPDADLHFGANSNSDLVGPLSHGEWLARQPLPVEAESRHAELPTPMRSGGQ